MADVGAIVTELQEALRQRAAIDARIEALVKGLGEEVAAEGASLSVVPYQAIVDEWNRRCASVGMMRRTTIGTLKAAALRVWRRYANLDLWKAAFDACARNDWWRGERGGWRGSLESFLRPAHYGNFFDQGLGAAEPAPSGTVAVGASAPTVDAVEEEISALLDDRARPLPSGFKGPDPREVRGKDDAEFVRRLDLLKEWLAGDWRFGG